MADTSETEPQDRREELAKWQKELAAARKRESKFRTTGRRVLELYDGTKAEEVPFNILYSNTETLQPALYSATPRPVVQRRFKDDDPLGKAASQAGQRMLEFLLDTNLADYETYDEGMAQATLNALLPGRAFTAIKYDAESDDGAGETICLDSKTWNRVLHGYAHRWQDVPWVAYEDYIDEPEATRLFGKEMADKLTYSDVEQKAASDDLKGSKEEPNQGERKLACIYQVWDKEGGRKVRYYSEQYLDDYLKVEDDPLGLTGFFNCPKPLTFLKKPHTLTPTALYVLYESQAKELNELTRRLKKITIAIKARGIYDGSLGGDLQKMMEADDNELIPTETAATLSAEKGLDHAIWFMPVDKLIIVLRELYQAREQCKQVIYEITGISDILRGATKASETLGAQEIKTQWGTLRLKRAQKEVARYARDLLRMMLELAATKFSEETWAKMTGLPFLLSSKYNELTALAKTLTQELQRVQASQPPPQPGPPAMPGQPPQAPAPPPMPPQVQQLQQIQQALQAPQWKDVLAMLKNDYQRAYRIDIETNSTVEPEAAEDQKMISDVMTAMGQVLNGIGPLVAKGVLPFEAAQVMLLTIVRRFRFGSELEDTIKAMQPPRPEGDGGKAEIAQMQQQMASQQMQAQQQTAQSQLQVKSMAAEKEILNSRVDLQLREIQLKAEQDKLIIERSAFEKEMSMREQLHQAKLSPEAMMQEDRKQQRAHETEKMKAKIQADTDLKKTAMQGTTQIEVARIGAEAQANRPKAVPA